MSRTLREQTIRPKDLPSPWPVPRDLQTDDQIDAFFAAALGMSVEELRRYFYDPDEPEMSDEEINRLVD